MTSGFVPKNELGVIALFSMDCQYYGWSIVSISASYPDAVIKKEGEVFRAEFEFSSSNFREHGHDPRECDLIICWHSDWPDCVLPVLSLQDWDRFVMKTASDDEKEIMYLRMENSRLRNALHKSRIINQQIPADQKDKKRVRNWHLASPGPDWRLELTQGGRYYQWRKGRGKNRTCIYGGPVSEMPENVRVEYGTDRGRKIWNPNDVPEKE